MRMIKLVDMFRQTKQLIQRRLVFSTRQQFSYQKLTSVQVPRGHFAIYVENDDDDHKKRFVVPISYLKHPLFQELLRSAAEEFGYNQGLIIPCTEYYFLDLISQLN
ncbi:hypothetical protein RND81_14G239400 [Saponaria officinalis]|uniref:Uncharacterized protein n=1 Tax=Saponaria officinalis TaxID=3572 RepID=A0AAW1GXA0_SAPOF